MAHIANANKANKKHEHDNARIIARVWAKTHHLVKYKIRGLCLSMAAEDIAAEAIEYALKAIKWKDVPKLEKRLFRTARKVAGWIICREIKKARNSIMSFDLDTREVNEDGEEQELSKAETDYSEELHRAEQAQNEKMAKGRAAFAQLDDFLKTRGVSERDIAIFKDWYLYNIPTDVVCRKHQITQTNLHRIVCLVKQILRTDGPLLIAA